MKAAMEVRFESQLRTVLAPSERVCGLETLSVHADNRARTKGGTNHEREQGKSDAYAKRDDWQAVLGL